MPEPVGVPETVDGVRELELIAVETGPQRALWNELMAREHPRGAGPLVGAQLRYLVGSAHGWLGGLGFGGGGVAVAGPGTAGSDGMRNNAGRTCTGWWG